MKKDEPLFDFSNFGKMPPRGVEPTIFAVKEQCPNH